MVSLGGAAKAHLLEFFLQAAKGAGEPKALCDEEGNPPFRRAVGNFSALATAAKARSKIVYCPDEWGLAVHPSHGPAPKGTSGNQMMSMQATGKGDRHTRTPIQTVAARQANKDTSDLSSAGAHQLLDTGIRRRHARSYGGQAELCVLKDLAAVFKAWSDMFAWLLYVVFRRSFHWKPEWLSSSSSQRAS